MSSLPTVLLKPGEADRVLAGHPWIYKGSILRLTRPAEDGDLVQVKDHRQRLIGTGFYNSKSKIHVRMISSDRVVVDRDFFLQRLKHAQRYREMHMPGATSYRLVNSESDFLSGLIVDRYEDALVVQITGLGMERHKKEIFSALERVCEPRFLVERSDTAARSWEGLEPAVGLIKGEDPVEVSVRLNELEFPVRPLTGHKTGLYLDQQVNYARVADLARRGGVRQALDCFSFQGGFSLHLARAGVEHVHAIEQSEEVVTQAGETAAHNGLGGRCTFEAANVFDWLKTRTAKGAHEKLIAPFDLVVLDPPSFTRSKHAVPDALRGYKEIHLRAMRLLKPGGILATFCCSHHVDAALFMDVILSAAYDARCVLRRLEVYGQSPDHPVIPSIPETEYLKGFAFEVIR